MVSIKDMEMPSCCMNCGLLGKEEMYCSIYPRKDLDIITVATNRPNWCPLVEIVTCKDCKHRVFLASDNDGNTTYMCDKHCKNITNENFYCADAERRE